ncbi:MULTISPECIES: DUF6346 domain-containing protein [Actinokineospora]|uniref:Uncharacterized protein n=1 Tax=Actinokineospora fastidiosa TaxID=1816 RepID=A0A918GA15_9PSEU|nr:MULTISPECIES: DUF6346 domain-containing protein [Actinokineospora]GGS25426.1 hypothetical protein GCM10010171_18430 [Actinokineospora fastidiosa]
MGMGKLAALITTPVGLAIALAGLNAADRMGAFVLGTEITDRGVATVLGCQDEGVIDGLTVGDLWRCDLDVRWDSGRVERVRPDDPLQFGPEDGQVAVVERAVPQGNRTGARAAQVYRADFEPRPLWLIALVGGGLGVLGALVALSPIARKS